MSEQVNTANLEVLEDRAEQALEKAETGWREFARTMREIKDSEAYRPEYRYFQTYYRERWEMRSGKAFNTVKGYLEAADIEQEVALVGGDLVMPSDYNALRHLQGVEGAEEKARIIREAQEAPGNFRDNLLASVRERESSHGAFKGVIEQAEARGLEVPPMPSGATLPEQAYLATSDLAILTKGVAPVEAARAHPSGSVAVQLENLETLAHWIKLFVEEAHLYTAESGSYSHESH